MRVCNNFRKCIQASPSGGLPPDLKAHLDECKDCAKYYSATRIVDGVINGLKNQSEKELPIGLRTQILENIRIYAEQKEPFFRIFLNHIKPISIAAIAMLVIVSAIYLLPCRNTANARAYTSDDFISQSIMQAKESYESNALAQKTSKVLRTGGDQR
ncbi:MAG: hypothetical protein ABII64_04365 [Elusimicrobiota bacterium]